MYTALLLFSHKFPIFRSNFVNEIRFPEGDGETTGIHIYQNESGIDQNINQIIG